MNLEQKAQVLIGTGMFMDLPDSVAKLFFPEEKKEIIDTAYQQMVDHIRTYLPGAAGFSAEFPELNISSQVLADGPAGLRIQPTRKGEDQTYYCTAFPIATVLASTWDTDLIYKVGQAMGNEVLEYGADVLLAPGMNIQRDPLCGRNFEYYSEDPLVTGKMAAAMVNGVQSNGVGTSIKHFAVNNQETNRLSVDATVSQRALREIYLKGFEIAVKDAQPWTVMSSYNKVNGTYTSESHDLLTKILRNDWGFEGYVMTDWGGGSDVVAQMKAGNDMIMPGTPEQIERLQAAVKEGQLDEKVLDQNLIRIFTVMFKSPKFKGYQNSNKPDLKAHAQITRQAATEGMVLLENKENTLPFSIANAAVFGTTSYDFIAGGTGSGDVNEAYTVSLMEGLSNGNIAVNEELATTYEDYIKKEQAKGEKSDNWLTVLMGGKVPVAEMEVSTSLAKKMAATNEMALITIGRNSGEGGDREPVEGDFYLTATEKGMIKTVTDAFHAVGKKVVVILNVGGVIETASWSKIPDAVLLAWQGGQEGGNSVVDILTGKVNPSGKLAITFPVSYDDTPTHTTFPGHEIEGEVDEAEDLSGFSFMKRVPWEVFHEEDIYVGYRYYNTFDVPVAYPFGYGLSYTSFKYDNIKTDKDAFDGKITVSVDVVNAGEVAGKEVVQVYLHAPSEKMEKPEATLIDFGKTGLLQPGESQTLSFEIEAKDLASFDTATSSWVAEDGDYQLLVGSSSLDIKGAKDFSLPEFTVVEKVSEAMKPIKELNILTKK
ncbi:glycoside hydrolase family 3 C-terminal domain-containing protein [Carboxylicivirga linearis]|uniref:Glycoside hydrolase family 3 C-terminal domain-containing protein n=2 Tax=Carboxylicivirga linearis TaxID=1628157 RepID=A0ABS5JY21_9BACT|nr:glycoside hydrolase family 3 C-terminal domain-containing protein [Carboxylicivirga linearis]